MKREMKGIVVVGAVKALRRWLRGQTPEPELGLSPEARLLLRSREILPSSWYPYGAYLELMTVAHEEMLGGDDEAFREFVAAGTPIVYGGAHRILIHDGDPGRTLRQVGSLWKTCHSFGDPRAEVADGKAIVHFEEVEGMTRLEGLVNAAWVAGAVEMAGGADVRWSWLEEPWAGGAELRVLYRWR